jgi:hypothetical protein
VESLAQNGLINDAITSFKLSRLADQKNDGEVTFGGLDQTKFDPSSLVTFDNVNTQGFWEGDMPSVTVNGQDAGLQGRTAILVGQDNRYESCAMSNLYPSRILEQLSLLRLRRMPLRFIKA